MLTASAANAQLAAFTGAVGQGATATGGRGGDVYHVTNLNDYASGQAAIPGSLRYGISSATGPRTIVFDVGGGIQLARPLVITKNNLTIAGQTSPTGITLWGYPTQIDDADDVVMRYMRFRTGDFNAALPDANGNYAFPRQGNGNMDLLADHADAFSVYRSDRVILDHLSTAWSMDEVLSVTLSKNVTVQNTLITQPLNSTWHWENLGNPSHGLGSLVRGIVTAADQAAGVGGYTFYGNLWAHALQRSPVLGGEQNGSLDGDFNLVNNVIYDWVHNATHTVGGDIRVNTVGNYYINGPNGPKLGLFGASSSNAQIYQDDTMRDSDQDALHDGILLNTQALIDTAYVGISGNDTINPYGQGTPYNFFNSVAGAVITAAAAYDQVVATAGASIWRDSLDQLYINELINRTGLILESQEQLRVNGVLPGIDDLIASARPIGFDTDSDGMPDYFEEAFGLDKTDPSDRNLVTLHPDGYTNLEFYLNYLADGYFSPIILTGDANNDGVVDATDFLAVEANLGALGGPNGLLLGDANDDGRVDGDDWLAVERYYGATLFGVFSVPEPGIISSMLALLMLALRLRRPMME